jgi:hypothetical protein
MYNSAKSCCRALWQPEVLSLYIVSFTKAYDWGPLLSVYSLLSKQSMPGMPWNYSCLCKNECCVAQLVTNC